LNNDDVVPSETTTVTALSPPCSFNGVPVIFVLVGLIILIAWFEKSAM